MPSRILIAIVCVLTLLTVNGCFKRHPDTCEYSQCDLTKYENNELSKKLNPGESKTIEICACKSWNKSDIRMTEKEKYFFQVLKITEPWEDGVISANPHDGWSGISNKIFGWPISYLKRSSEAGWYVLIGSLGDSDSPYTFSPLDFHGQGKNGEPLKAGEDKYGYVFTVKDGIKDYELYFYANDAKGRYFNNKGRLTLKITRHLDDKPSLTH